MTEAGYRGLYKDDAGGVQVEGGNDIAVPRERYEQRVLEGTASPPYGELPTKSEYDALHTGP